MDTKEMIEVLKAYEEGKQIQLKSKGNDGDYYWVDIVGNIEWDFVEFDYRIKPEPKYRPYKDTEEMIEDYKKRFNVKCKDYEMPLIWVESKTTTNRYLIVSYYRENNVIQGVRINADKYNLEDLFADYYTYLDGSPIGKSEEE